MTLLYLILSVAVHADYAVVDRTLSFRDQRRLFHHTKLFLFNHRGGRDPRLCHIGSYNCGLLLD